MGTPFLEDTVISEAPQKGDIKLNLCQTRRSEEEKVTHGPEDVCFVGKLKDQHALSVLREGKVAGDSFTYRGKGRHEVLWAQ